MLVHEVEVNVPADGHLILRGQHQELVAAAGADGLGFALVDGVAVVDTGDEHGPGGGRLALKGDGAEMKSGKKGCGGRSLWAGAAPKRTSAPKHRAVTTTNGENKPPHTHLRWRHFTSFACCGERKITRSLLFFDAEGAWERLPHPPPSFRLSPESTSPPGWGSGGVAEGGVVLNCDSFDSGDFWDWFGLPARTWERDGGGVAWIPAFAGMTGGWPYSVSPMKSGSTSLSRFDAAIVSVVDRCLGIDALSLGAWGAWFPAFAGMTGVAE